MTERKRGRPAELNQPSKRNVTLEARHWAYLQQQSGRGNSAALRAIIDRLIEAEDQRAAQAVKNYRSTR